MTDRSPLSLRRMFGVMFWHLGQALANPCPRANPHQMAAIYTDHRNSPRTDAAAGGQNPSKEIDESK